MGKGKINQTVATPVMSVTTQKPWIAGCAVMVVRCSVDSGGILVNCAVEMYSSMSWFNLNIFFRSNIVLLLAGVVLFYFTPVNSRDSCDLINRCTPYFLLTGQCIAFNGGLLINKGRRDNRFIVSMSYIYMYQKCIKRQRWA